MRSRLRRPGPGPGCSSQGPIRTLAGYKVHTVSAKPPCGKAVWISSRNFFQLSGSSTLNRSLNSPNFEQHFHDTHIRPSLTATQAATMLSSSGRNASTWLIACPVDEHRTFTNEQFQYAVRRRLRVDLVSVGGRCPGTRCTAELDAAGDHMANCARTGHLATRGNAYEHAWMKVM